MLTWLNGVVEILVDGLNVLVWWRVEDDDDGTEQTDGTAESA